MSGSSPLIQTRVLAGNCFFNSILFCCIKKLLSIIYFGTTPNKPMIVYDTAGPYHDEKYEVNVEKGIPKLRDKWIAEREDTYSYEGPFIRISIFAFCNPFIT